MSENTASAQISAPTATPEQVAAAVATPAQAVAPASLEPQTANRIKSEFLAAVTHELRTPMNVILGWLEILRTERPERPALEQALLTIERNALMQMDLINDLLDMSRIHAGKMTLATRPLDPAEAVNSALESVRPAAIAKSIQFLNVREPGVPPIHGDRDRLQQVIWNLLMNAVKFTPVGGTVEVKLGCEDGHVRIEVRDTGEGIDASFLPKVFDGFSQEDAGTDRRHGGLGLGLSIVRHLTEAHGGSVEAHSEGKGKGATFTLRFPALAQTQEPALAADSPFSVAVPAPTTASAPGAAAELAPRANTLNRAILNDLDVLLVDHASDTRTSLAIVLSKAGAHVRAVGTAAEALQTLRRNSPDMLVCDVDLPETDGYELVRKVRELEAAKHRPPVPAIALSAHPPADGERQALEAGYDLHLAKPVVGPGLVDAVEKLARLRLPPDQGVPMLHV